jgi:hypothetical protein
MSDKSKCDMSLRVSISSNIFWSKSVFCSSISFLIDSEELYPPNSPESELSIPEFCYSIVIEATTAINMLKILTIAII